MPAATLPKSAEPLAGSDRPGFGAIRSLRCLAQQNVYECKELTDLYQKGIGGSDKQVRQAALAYALDFCADADEMLDGNDDPYARTLHGMVLAAVEEYDDALTALRAGADGSQEAKQELVRVLIDSGDLDGADALIDELQGANANYIAGLYYNGRNEIERAIGSFEMALEQDPEHIEAAFQLGVLLDRIGDDDMALEHFLVCADVWPHFLPGVMNLGVLYDERGESNAAVDCFRQVLAHNPQSRRATLLMRDASASRSMYYDEKEEREREQMQKILKTSVNDFELSVRSRNCLAKMNIFTLGDLISITEQEMLNYKNFGETSLKEVREMLDARGLRLGMLREDEDRGLSKSDQKMLGEPIEKLELSSRSAQVLESIGCKRIGDVTQRSDLELYRVPGSGQSVVQEVFTALGAFSMKLQRPELR